MGEPRGAELPVSITALAELAVGAVGLLRGLVQALEGSEEQ